MTKKEFLIRWLMGYGSGPVYRGQIYCRDSPYMQMICGGNLLSSYRIPNAIGDGFLTSERFAGVLEPEDNWTLTQKALDYIEGDSDE